jgi:hypothetical protein
MMDVTVPLRLRELSQNPGVSISQDFQTPLDSPGGEAVDVLSQAEFRQQPYIPLASFMLSVQFEVQLTLDVAQSKLSGSLIK